jgi:hypothetical protein
VLKEHFTGEQENKSAQKIETPEVEWFVKWKALGYEQCTWEPAETGVLASRKASKLICAFDNWAEVAKQRTTQEAREEVGSGRGCSCVKLASLELVHIIVEFSMKYNPQLDGLLGCVLEGKWAYLVPK